MRRLWRAWERRDLDEVRALYHEEARVRFVWAGERTLTPDQAIQEMVRADEDPIYHAAPARLAAIDDHAVIVVGSIRSGTGSPGGHAINQYAWLLTVRDGLLWRGSPYPSEAAARTAYATLGPALAIAADADDDGGAVYAVSSSRAADARREIANRAAEVRRQVAERRRSQAGHAARWMGLREECTAVRAACEAVMAEHESKLRDYRSAREEFDRAIARLRSFFSEPARGGHWWRRRPLRPPVQHRPSSQQRRSRRRASAPAS